MTKRVKKTGGVVCTVLPVFFLLVSLCVPVFGEEIHEAAGKGDLETVKMLLQKDAERVNAKTRYGRTPLHNAARFGHKEVVELLLAKDAELNPKDRAGDTPLDLANLYEHNGIVRLLKEKGGRSTPLGDPEVRKLSQTVYRITFPYSLRTNIVVSAGADGVLLIDSGFLRTAKKLNAAVRELGKGDVKTIINTHGHGDHTGGNAYFKDRAAIFLSSDLDRMVSEGIVSRGKGGIKGRSGKTFDTYYTMSFNGEEIRLIPSPGAHSNQDLLIHFTGSGVVHMGDLLLSQSFPAVGRSVVKYMEILEKAIDIFPRDSTFISGHGRDCTMEDVKAYQNMLLTSIEMVQKGMKDGKSAKQMQKEKVLKAYESYDTFLDWLTTEYWIGAVYASYKNKIK